MTEQLINGHRLVENDRLSRIQLFINKEYDLGKSGRNSLKMAKFVWVASRGCYQSAFTHYNKFVAIKLLESFKHTDNEKSKST